ncbi:MAG: serine/threonine-protein kinase [Planctomycetota bacterium]
MEATVDEAKRREFESDWAVKDTIEIGDYLPAEDSNSYLPTLEELVCIDMEFHWESLARTPGSPKRFLEWYLKRFAALQEPSIIQRLVDHEAWVRRRSSSPAKPEEYLKRFPEITFTDSTYRRLISQCKTVELEQDNQQGGSDQWGFNEPNILPSEIEGYRVDSELGRGGMGVVFLAQQESTGRQVAIKVATIGNLPENIRAEHLSRVQQEIRASASLRHDHIMPVFEVGEVNGQPYYTMPVLDTDLGSLCKRNPLDGRLAANYLSQAARGVQAAHESGLLHRDLKPQNLMLDRSNDRVLVTDFGLARWQSESQELTRTGQLLGTPTFMPPEQIKDATAVDVRADVYAMGATLYHLLTGRPPLVCSEIAETLRQVMDEDPISVRQQNPSVDVDLETICMRCLQKEPALRYASAAELADDLDRYQLDEPIVARPLGVLGRLNRWRRRNPTPAKLLAGLLAALIALAMVGWLGWEATSRQFTRYQASIRQGHRIIDDLFGFIRSEPMLQRPGDEELRRRLLEQGRKHYGNLVQVAAEDETLAVDLVVASFLQSVIELELDGPAVALESLNASFRRADRLPKQLRSNVQVSVAKGDAWNCMGRARRQLGETVKAMEAFDEAVAIRSRVVNQTGSMESQRKLANALMTRGLVRMRLQRLDEAAEDLKSAQSKRIELLKEHPNDLKLRRDYAQGVFNDARLKALQDQLAESLEKVNRASVLFNELISENPTISELLIRRVQCLQTRSLLEQQIAGSNHDSALSVEPLESQTLSEASELLRRLSNLAPMNRSYLLELATLHHQITDGFLMTGQTKEASSVLGRAESEILSRIVSESPQIDLVLCKLHQRRLSGLLELERGELDLGLQTLEQALKDWESATKSLSSRDADPNSEWQGLRSELEQLKRDLADEIQ